MLNWLLLVGLFAQGPQTVRVAECTVAQSSDRTNWGATMSFRREPDPLKQIQGVVFTGAIELGANVLVELFDKPDAWDTWDFRHGEAPPQDRLAACFTSRKGRFRFEGVRDGRYELRVSAVLGFDSQSVILEVRKTKGRNTPLEVHLPVGR